jgi:hypothetical protein
MHHLRKRTITSTFVLASSVIAVIAIACGGGSDERSEQPPGGTGRIVGGVDLSLHDGALEDVHFDTFDGGSISLSEIGEERLLSLVDAIPPLDTPTYDAAAGGDWLDSDDLVIGYESVNGGAWAYPVKILNFHEIVNDDLDGVPVLISYCPLCRSAVVYDRSLDGRELTFGNSSALYENDLVMFDRETNSYWWQVAGRAIVGTLTGKHLDVLPSITTTWAAWREEHADTLVLSRETGFVRSYAADPFGSYRLAVNDEQFPFPVSAEALDGRLAAGDEVLGVIVNGESRAYSLRALGDAAVNDDLGDQPVVVLSSHDGPSGGAYSPLVDGTILTFSFEDGLYVDAETGTRWNLNGEAVDGELKGSTLERLPSRYTFWFAYVGAFPDTDVYAR